MERNNPIRNIDIRGGSALKISIELLTAEPRRTQRNDFILLF